VRTLTLAPGTQFATSCGGLFLFVPDLVRLGVENLAGEEAPTSSMARTYSDSAAVAVRERAPRLLSNEPS
jgi:hypothetical protein